MALVVAQEVPTSSTMAVPHGPAGVGDGKAPDARASCAQAGWRTSVVDDAVLILSELLSNACRHARPLETTPGPWRRTTVRRPPGASTRTGRLTVAVTDGGGPTRPFRPLPRSRRAAAAGWTSSRALAKDWGVRDDAARRGHGLGGALAPTARSLRACDLDAGSAGLAPPTARGPAAPGGRWTAASPDLDDLTVAAHRLDDAGATARHRAARRHGPARAPSATVVRRSRYGSRRHASVRPADRPGDTAAMAKKRRPQTKAAAPQISDGRDPGRRRSRALPLRLAAAATRPATAGPPRTPPPSWCSAPSRACPASATGWRCASWCPPPPSS